MKHIESKNLKKRIKEDIYKFEKSWTLPKIEQTLKKLKNINKLGLKPENILRENLDESKYNLDHRKQFNYCPSGLFTCDIKSLRRCAKFIFALDRLLGIFYKVVPNYNIKKLKIQFMNNFADFGLILAFVDFCYKRDIKILEYEPSSPSNKNKFLDFRILLNKREVFVECFSPIESMIKGKNLDDKIQREIEKHNLQYFNFPLIFVINISESHLSGNPFNRGNISDRMFEPIRFVERYDVNFPQKFNHVSAIFIKYGEIGKVFLNFTLWNLMPKEIDLLTSEPSFFRRIFG